MKPIVPVLLLFIPVFGFNQEMSNRQSVVFTENYAKCISGSEKSHFVRIVFYNLENLLDPHSDTNKPQEKLTQNGIKKWTFTKFFLKLNHLAKTFIAIGGWEPPAMIGVCEVENKFVMNQLIYQTPIKKYKYKFIHYDSPDLRGIDVALLYRPSVLKINFSRNIRIRFPFDTLMHTRDILYVKGILFTHDTIHVFINHWPSRLGGFSESVPKRRVVAQTLRAALDTLQQNQHDPKIIIMGDFNDEPDQPAITETLQSVPFSPETISTDLVNLMVPLMNNPNEGTYKFQGKWGILDQFMVSGNLLINKKGLITSQTSVHIFHPGFLLKEDDHFTGNLPFRTYSGPRYIGGFSDHLPVYLDLWEN